MLFSSISFLYYFLPIVIILYLAVPGQVKNYVLLLGSLFFYAWGEPKYIILMVLTITLGYFAGLLLEKFQQPRFKKSVLAISVCLFLGILGIFKYADFFIGSINSITGSKLSLLKLALPIGISFYTFQLISYLIDVYRGTTAAQHNFIKLAVYICMFPQLIAGPIVRYIDIRDRLENVQISGAKISYGITRFSIGLGKKVLIANSLGELSALYKQQAAPSVLFTWLYAIASALQIYFDFSGYSDMAIGLGSILGFDFPENFKHPFISLSATEFWRRWHITLGSWFRDYLYIPMGGSRVSTKRHLFNLFVVWMATGLWHGASWNFVLWGVFYALLLIIEKYGLLRFIDRHHLFGHIYLILTCLISFIIFDNTQIALGLQRIGYLFGIGTASVVSSTAFFYLKDYAVILIVACIGATELPVKVVSKIKGSQFGMYFNMLEPLFNLALIILSTAFLINGSFNPFLYFRF